MDILGFIQSNLLASNNQFLQGGLVLGLLGGMMVWMKSMPRKVWDWFLRACTVNVDVISSDATYKWILLWLNNQSYISRARRLSLRYVKYKPVLVPAKGNHLFMWNKRVIWLNSMDEENKSGSAENWMMPQTREKISIRILGRDRSLVTKLVAEAEALQKDSEDERIKVYRREDGTWQLNLFNRRPLSTIFLPEQAKDLVEDMRSFMAKEDWYRKVGVPYRRGYLFHGPPGNGKSSSIVGLASELDVPIYVLNLGSISSDVTLEGAIRSVETAKPTILVIEDIDTAVPSRDHDKAKQNINLGTLLNLMDGLSAKENLMLVATTNRKDSLDKALVRPGRIDRMIEFPNASKDQIMQAATVFNVTGATVDNLLSKAGAISMAQVQEAMLGASLVNYL